MTCLGRAPRVRNANFRGGVELFAVPEASVVRAFWSMETRTPSRG
jgi:hypothetical protein